MTKENDSLAEGQQALKVQIKKLTQEAGDSTKKISGYVPGTVKYKRQERVVKPVMKATEE